MAQNFTLLSFAFRNLWRKTLRTGILIISISLLVASLVFAISFVNRVSSGIELKSERLGADLIVVPIGARGAAKDVLLENVARSFYMDKSLVERIKEVEGIAKVTYQTYLVTLPSICCATPEVLVVAFNQETDFIVRPWLREAIGRDLKEGEAIAGIESALNIDLGLIEVDLVLFGEIFRMAGTLERTDTGFDNAVFISDESVDDIIREGKSPLKAGQISIILAKVKEGVDPSEVAWMINDNFIEVDAVARKDIGKGMVSALRDINLVFYMTIALASMLSVFLSWAIFLAIASERAKEVGIMRAIGAKESHIVTLFFTEVIIIGIIGSLLGIIFGNALYHVFAGSFGILQNLATDLTLIQWSYIAIVGFVIGIAVCFIGAILPVHRLKKMEPLVVIKGV